MPSMDFKTPSFNLSPAVRIGAIIRRKSKGKAIAKEPKLLKRRSKDSSASSSSLSSSFKRPFKKSKVVSADQEAQMEESNPCSCPQKPNVRAVATALEQLHYDNPALPGPSDRCRCMERKLQWQFLQMAELPFTYGKYHEQLHALEKAYQNRKSKIKEPILSVGGKARGEGRLDAGLASAVDRLGSSIHILHGLIATHPKQASRTEVLARGNQVLSRLEGSVESLERFESKLREAVQCALCFKNRKQAPFYLEAVITADAFRLMGFIRGCIVTVDLEIDRLQFEIDRYWRWKIRRWFE